MDIEANNIYSIKELKTITGTKQKSKMIAVLKDWNIPFKVNALGWPVVHESAFIHNTQNEQEPDFSHVAQK